MGPVLLASACLCGQAVRYDGTSCLYPALKELAETGLAVPFCPECEGGLSVPRLPAECWKGRVVRSDGTDCTAAFEEGARRALVLCREKGCVAAVLKENSPSCGVHRVYDGSFSGRKVEGEGITARLLRSGGIRVFSEAEWEEALAFTEKFRK